MGGIRLGFLLALDLARLQLDLGRIGYLTYKDFGWIWLLGRGEAPLAPNSRLDFVTPFTKVSPPPIYLIWLPF